MKEVDRVRLLSLVGFAILIGLCGSALAVSFAPSDLDTVTGADTFGPGIGVQAGTSAEPSPSMTVLKSAAAVSPSVSSSVTVTGQAPPLVTAKYRTIALLGLGGFDTEVTVAGPSGPASWTVILVMPANKKVENRSPGLVTVKQEGTKITITPTAKTQLPLMFSIRFPAVLALGGKVSSCTIDGRPCKAE